MSAHGKRLLDLNKAYTLFLKGQGFVEIAHEMSVDAYAVAHAIGRMGDLEWRTFREGI